jgi:hypothetical protein
MASITLMEASMRGSGPYHNAQRSFRCHSSEKYFASAGTKDPLLRGDLESYVWLRKCRLYDDEIAGQIVSGLTFGAFLGLFYVCSSEWKYRIFRELRGSFRGGILEFCRGEAKDAYALCERGEVSE